MPLEAGLYAGRRTQPGKAMPIGSMALLAITLVAANGVTDAKPGGAIADALSGFANADSARSDSLSAGAATAQAGSGRGYRSARSIRLSISSAARSVTGCGVYPVRGEM